VSIGCECWSGSDAAAERGRRQQVVDMNIEKVKFKTAQWNEKRGAQRGHPRVGCGICGGARAVHCALRVCTFPNITTQGGQFRY